MNDVYNCLLLAKLKALKLLGSLLTSLIVLHCMYIHGNTPVAVDKIVV